MTMVASPTTFSTCVSIWESSMTPTHHPQSPHPVPSLSPLRPSPLVGGRDCYSSRLLAGLLPQPFSLPSLFSPGGKIILDANLATLKQSALSPRQSPDPSRQEAPLPREEAVLSPQLPCSWCSLPLPLYFTFTAPTCSYL